MLNYKKYFITVIVPLFLLSGCAGVNNIQQQNLVNSITETFHSCIKSNFFNKKTAHCAIDFYNAIQSVPTNDYGKPAALNFATAMYEAFLKYDRGQFNASDMAGQVMRIENNLNAELEQARRRSVAENMELARYRQQMFIEAAKMLNPPRNGISCISQNSGFITTTNCN